MRTRQRAPWGRLFWFLPIAMLLWAAGALLIAWFGLGDIVQPLWFSLFPPA